MGSVGRVKGRVKGRSCGVTGRWIAVLGLAGAAGADSASEGHAWLSAQIAWLDGQRQSPPERVAEALVERAVDVDAFARLAFRDYVEDSLADVEEHLPREPFELYVQAHRDDLLRALRQRLVADLAAQLGAGALPDELAVTAAAFDDGRGEVTVTSESAATPLVCHLGLTPDGRWRLVDLRIGSDELSARYRQRYHETLDRGDAPAVLEAQLAGRDYVVLEDFSYSEPGEVPVGWGWRDRDENRDKPYRVGRQGDRFFLAARDSGSSVLIGRLSQWNPREYPIMSWCWRADALPPGGDERFGHTNDSVAGLYVFFSQNWLGAPRHVKYVWSTTLAYDFVGRRNRIFRPWFVVVESGDANLGRWTFEAVDLERDYERTYGGRPKNRTQGLGLLTDANSTDSVAEAYYADLRVWTRAAWEAGRVRDYCDGYRALDSLTSAGTGPQAP